MQALLKEIDSLRPLRRFGRVARIEGLLVEVTGAAGAVSLGGQVSLTCSNSKTIPCEVVGFREGRAQVMPLGTLDGVSLGAAAAITIALHLSRPEASLRGWVWLLIIPAGLLVGGISGEMMVPQRLPMMTRLVGSNSKVCMTAIPMMSLPLLAASLVGLRHGAPTRPAAAGAMAGLLSAGLAATVYASHCTDDSPLFVATWYSLAAALVTALGALLGSKLLRF